VKVAVVGNMNNNMFALTRHLRDRELDAELLFARFHDLEHFHPKADTFDLADLAFCHQVPWIDKGFYAADPKAIRNDMRGYDVVLGTGIEAAALSLAGVRIDIYFAYGSDVLTYSHLPRRLPLRTVAEEELRFLVKRRRLAFDIRDRMESAHLRRAICTAPHLISDWTNDWWDDRMLSLPLEGAVHRSPWPILYPAPYRSGRWTDVHWRSAMDQLRSDNDLIVLYHGRHIWSRSDEESKNANHVLVGFAEFLRQHPGLSACLITLDYGPDVDASKALTAELGVKDRVVWFPRMNRKDVMYLVATSDVCCGDFNLSWLAGGVIFEALSMGKPLIHYRDDSLYEGIPLYPILNAREPAEIATAIASYVEDPAEARRRGKEGARWFDEYVVRRPLDLICGLIEGCDGRGAGTAVREVPV
jgi:glycosyltransferase involved in cell wall biosynthesis